MTPIMLIFVASLASALAFTPLARMAARRIGFTDKPSARKLHTVPIPLLGGVAIYVAVLCAVLLFGRHHVHELLGILLAATLMALLGLLDDRVSLPAVAKLAGQLLIVSGLYLAGVRVHLGWLPPWVNYLLTVVWLLTICNAVNFLDNMDGLCAGVSAVCSAFFMIIAAINGQKVVCALAAAVFGGCAGFFYYNKKPASIFMGDAGSLFLGLLLGVVGIKLRFPEHSNFVTWMVPVMVLALPVFDTSLVFVSRLRRGVNPFTTAGKDHISHRLVESGLSQLEAVLVLCLASGAGGLLAIFIMQANLYEGYQAGAAAALAGLFMLWKYEWRRPRNDAPAPQPAGHCQDKPCEGRQ